MIQRAKTKGVPQQKARASIFEDVLDVDVSDFAAKKRADHDAPPREQVRAVAEAANFRSREGSPTAPTAPKSWLLAFTGPVGMFNSTLKLPRKP
jgi:hypothetical protein